MKRYSTESIRNISLVGAKGVGKTSLTEAILFNAKVTNRLGSVGAGNTVSDFDPSEAVHKQSLTSKILSFEWNGCKVNWFDTPGFSDFFGEALQVLWVSDVICLVLDASAFHPTETKKFLDWAKRLEKPVCFFVNRLDGPRAQWRTTWEKIEHMTDGHAVLFALPCGEGSTFKGIVDLVAMQSTTGTIPPELQDEVKAQHIRLIEDAAEESESLMERYLEKGELSKEELKSAFAAGIAKRDFFPVFAGSATQNIGVQNFLDLLVDDFPSPAMIAALKKDLPQKSDAGLVAQVFKITSDPGLGEIFYLRLYSGTLTAGVDLFNVNKAGSERIGHLFVMRGKERTEIDQAVAGDIIATAKLKNTSIGDTFVSKNQGAALPSIPFPEPMVSFALKVASRGEQDKLGLGLSKLMRTDPTFRMHIDKEFAETIVSGLGEQHIEVMVERLKERYEVHPTLDKPHIPYRETITRKAEDQGKYKKQTGGHGQYGDCWLRIEPLARGKGIEFASEIVGGAIPSKYIPSVEKGVREAVHKGVMAGYPVVDCKITVYDGSYHDVDSSDLAFQIAASMAFKKVEEEAKPILLEPIMNVEVTTPPQYVGDVTSDMSSRRGRVQSMENAGEIDVIRASIPLAELYKYSGRLRSITSGAAAYTMTFSHYEPVPPNLVVKITAETKVAANHKATA